MSAILGRPRAAMPQYDPSAMGAAIAAMSTHLTVGAASAARARCPRDIDRILICGMGGSGIAGALWRTICRETCQLPVELVRGRRVPGGVGWRTLAILISYSGTTTETLEAAATLAARGACMVSIGSGGPLADVIVDAGGTHIVVPGGAQPRAALGYLFGALATVLQPHGGVDDIVGLAAAGCSAIRPDEAVTAGEELDDSIPLIYADERLSAVGYRWKTQLNENAKRPAFFHTLPEANHNEVVGFEQHASADFAAFVLLPKGDALARRSAETTISVVEQRLTSLAYIEGVGTTLAEQVFSLVAYGDWLSYSAAVSADIDPTPVSSIVALKRRLNRIHTESIVWSR